MNLEQRHARMIQQAIRERRLLSILLVDEQRARLCIPFDYRPGIDEKTGGFFVVYEFEETGVPGARLELASDRLLGIRMLDLRFCPEEFIGWPREWNVARNWPGVGLAGHRNLTGV